MFRRSPPPPKILGQKAKSNHSGDSNEPQIILQPFVIFAKDADGIGHSFMTRYVIVQVLPCLFVKK